MRHILLGQPDLLGPGAVHIHGQIGLVERLLDARIGRAGNIADLVEHAFGEGAVAIQIRADNLDVDGRREAEVQNLRDNVHRQHIKRDAGILLGQHAAQALHISRGGVVIRAQLHLDVRVGGADRRRGRVGEVQRELGRPMLSTMVTNSLAGICSRMVEST